MPQVHAEPDMVPGDDVPPTAQAPSPGKRMLLVNPPVVDSRFPWARWQQPSRLQRYSTFYRRSGGDVQLLDALVAAPSGRLTRQKTRRIMLDGQAVDLWRFGRPRQELAKDLHTLASSGWSPEEVLIDCFTSFWWRGAEESVQLSREVFPDARIQIVGGYAATAPEHVRNILDAEPLSEVPPEVQGCATDWELIRRRPAIGYLSTQEGMRSAEEIIVEIKAARACGVGCFAFAEHGLIGKHATLFRAVLESVIKAKFRNIRFVVTGTASPGELAAEPDLPGLMYRAGYRQIFFADDRDAPLSVDADEARVEDYHRVAALCHQAGFAARSDALSGGVSLGRRGEDLSVRTKLITRIAHAIGSVVIWPYQPDAGECQEEDLELSNGKLYPLRTLNGATYRDYLNVMGIAVVLNAKYREYTFDFLGDRLVARMFRDSLAREAWIPETTLKGPVSLPVVQKRRSA